MRVLFVINSLEAKFPVDLAAHLQSGGACEVAIFPLLRPGRRSQSFFHKLGFLLQLPLIIHRMRRKIRSWQPDIIHTHFWLSDIIGAIAARPFSNVRLISTQHDAAALPKFVRDRKRTALQHFSAVIAVSKAVAEFTIRRFDVPAALVSTIYNGIDTRKFLQGAKPVPDSPVIGCIARLEPIKGVDIFIEALALLPTHQKEMVHAIVIGNGSEREMLESRVKNAGLSEAVRFVGAKQELVQHYQHLDVVVVPSRSEGLSVTIIEALASQKLVIASDIGGIPELIIHGQTGLLVQAGSAQPLSETIQWAMENPEQSQMIAARGHAWLLAHPQFDIAETIRSYQKIYAALI